MVAFMTLGFVGLAARLVYLQIFQHEQLAAAQEGVVGDRRLLEPRRGDILDRNGKILASSVWVKSISADPTLIRPYHREVAKALAPVLGADARDLENRLKVKTFVDSEGKTRERQWVGLARKVSKEKWEKIKQVMRGLEIGDAEALSTYKGRMRIETIKTRAVYADEVEDQLRVYQYGALASHVMGYVGRGTVQTAIGDIDSSSVGKAGIEYSFNARMTGVAGWRTVSKKRRGGEVVALRRYDVAPVPGDTVVLSLDCLIQDILEEELQAAFEYQKPISISGVVVRPSTGEVLAMANMPTFDANRLGDSNEAERRNRVITDIAEPGSTFKIVVVSGALDQQAVQLEDVFFCEKGRWPYAGRILHDHHSYKNLTVRDVIAKSSNIGAAKIAIQHLGKKKSYQYVRDYGYGSLTEIPLPGEARGIVHPLSKWSNVMFSRIPMGHSVASTLLQTAMAVSAIANDGVLMRPMLVDRIVDHKGGIVARFEPERVREVTSRRAAKEMVRALKAVVSKGGTATRAGLDYYTVAGKTGTAEKINEHGRYDFGKNYTSFVGFFPADQPEVLIAIAIDEPKKGRGGGTTAAPVFKKVAERIADYLNVRPDKFLESESGNYFTAISNKKGS